ncbi:hypothetical protein BDN72DRAFT_927404 [Pluteus cervinus]|uniref:Uncharacterized protein n=1 Tax=Pluteus cervinus TaxID=181527 RepID=A0ACD3ADD8_9AGAR|nr:hypothetical protein BDN72DRAFT_927404 [Pluteus cervinus]
MATADNRYAPIDTDESEVANMALDETTPTTTPTSGRKRPRGQTDSVYPSGKKAAEDAAVTLPSHSVPAPPARFHIPSGLNVTPRPRDGFPDIQGITQQQLFAYLTPECLQLWKKQDARKSLIGHLANDYLAPPEVLLHQAQQLQQFLSELFEREGIIVCPPDLRTRTPTPGQKPLVPYLILGLEDPEVAVLVNHKCWSMTDLTVFINLFIPPTPTFVATLCGFNLPTSSGGCHTVALKVKEVLESDPEIKAFIERHNDNIAPGVKGGIIGSTMTSITISPLRVFTGSQKTIPLFNFYINSPTNDPDLYEKWLEHLRKKAYTSIYGTGRPRNDYHCNICKTWDHPAGLCAYPECPGWLGPTHPTHPSTVTSAADEYNRQPASRGGSNGGRKPAYAGRGRRGRGRGRT